MWNRLTAMAEKVKPPARGPAPRSGDYIVEEHKLSPVDVARALGVNVNMSAIPQSKGLTNAEAAKRLAENGPNVLEKRKQTPEWVKIMKQLANPLLILLLIAAILAFVSYGIGDPPEISNIYVGAVLVLVIVLLAFAAYYNERAASRVTDALASLLPSNTNVIRDGEEMQVHASTVVVGDLVHLTIGQRVPADIKVIESRDLKLDFSSLTGESDPIPMKEVAEHDAVHESRNIAFMSSQILNGEGYGIVIRCADATFLGKMNTLTFGVDVELTNLQKDLSRFVRFVVILSVVMGLMLFIVALARGEKLQIAFVNALVTTLVANIPQGLPATVTAMLAHIAMKLRDNRVVVKRADIVEGLGAASRIASDKTGTLTQNKMSVMNCWVNAQFRSAGEILAHAAPRDIARPSISRSSHRSRLGNLSNSKLARGSMSRSSLSQVKESKHPDFTPSMRNMSAREIASGPVSEASESEPIKASSIRRQGTDLLSRMSVGVVAEPNFARSSAMTFAVNLEAHLGPGEAARNVFNQLSPLSRLLTIVCCNNAAQFAAAERMSGAAPVEEQERRVLGDATDAGLLRFCDALVDVDSTRASFSTVFTIPFSSVNKWALAMTHIPGDSEHYLVTIKGAPEYVVRVCAKYLYKGDEPAITDDFLEDMNEAYQSFGLLAERVIGSAYKIVPRASLPTLPKTQEDAAAAGLIEGFTFCGLLSLIDPPREAVPQAVRLVRRAGVSVTMVTGDHPITAEAIARKCNIVTTPTRREVAVEYGVEEAQVPLNDPNVRALIVTGAMIDNNLKTDDDWDEVLDKEELVFARTTPQHKLLIVTHFQRRGDVVAVTGDGVNDAPALRQANIGVAMGNPNSSEVAREAADVVLLDDNFAALVDAIAEGRRLYDNLKKVIGYTMTHIPAEAWGVVVNLLFGMPLGLGSLILLTIDLVTEQGPAGSLAFEPPESNLMERAPRNVVKDRLVDVALYIYMYVIAGTVEGFCAFSGYLWTYHINGVNPRAIFWISTSDSWWEFEGTSGYAPTASHPQGYSPSQQEHIARQAGTAWYMLIILCQFWHIWMCKSRRVSIFKHTGIYTNKATIYGVIVALTVMSLCAYTPALQKNVFQSANPPARAAWLPHFLFLVIMLPYTEFIKYYGRNYPNSTIAHFLSW